MSLKKILPQKILPLIIAIIFLMPVYAEVTMDEVILDSLGEGVDISEDADINIESYKKEKEEIAEPHGEVVQVAEVSEETKEKTLAEKLRDVYHLEIEKIDRPSYLFENILTKEYKNNPVLDSTHIWGAYNGYWDYSIYSDSHNTSTYGFNAVNLGIDGKFKNDVADFRIMMGIIPTSHRNMTKNMFSDVYIGTDKIPHHRLMVGHMRPRVGMEGGNSAYTLPFILRSQIARNYGTARRIGARAIGSYKLIEYELGGYSSDTYFSQFFPGGEFVGWVNFKPLGLTNGKYGKLKIGGGIDAGHRDSGFCVVGAYVGYEYKKFFANFEWANADGYNGGSSGRQSRDHSTGFYTTIGYRITPKLQVLARYDEFDPDKHIRGNKKREYSFGINYFIKGQALRLTLNYIFCQNDGARDSHRIMLGTQILL